MTVVNSPRDAGIFETFDDGEFVEEINPEDVVYTFLKMHFFRNRVEVFSFFLKYWMPYGNRAAAGQSLWQQRCLD